MGYCCPAQGSVLGGLHFASANDRRYKVAEHNYMQSLHFRRASSGVVGQWSSETGEMGVEQTTRACQCSRQLADACSNRLQLVVSPEAVGKLDLLIFVGAFQLS